MNQNSMTFFEDNVFRNISKMPVGLQYVNVCTYRYQIKTWSFQYLQMFQRPQTVQVWCWYFFQIYNYRLFLAMIVPTDVLLPMNMHNGDMKNFHECFLFNVSMPINNSICVCARSGWCHEWISLEMWCHILACLMNPGNVIYILS